LRLLSSFSSSFRVVWIVHAIILAFLISFFFFFSFCCCFEVTQGRRFDLLNDARIALVRICEGRPLVSGKPQYGLFEPVERPFLLQKRGGG
jgi:hypothetical protein